MMNNEPKKTMRLSFPLQLLLRLLPVIAVCVLLFVLLQKDAYVWAAGLLVLLYMHVSLVLGLIEKR